MACFWLDPVKLTENCGGGGEEYRLVTTPGGWSSATYNRLGLNFPDGIRTHLVGLQVRLVVNSWSTQFGYNGTAYLSEDPFDFSNYGAVTITGPGTYELTQVVPPLDWFMPCICIYKGGSAGTWDIDVSFEAYVGGEWISFAAVDPSLVSTPATIRGKIDSSGDMANVTTGVNLFISA